MADIETYNFNSNPRVTASVIADSMRAIAGYLEAEGKLALARGFSEAEGIRIEPLVVHPEILAAAVAYCVAQGEPGIGAALRERFLIRE